MTEIDSDRTRSVQARARSRAILGSLLVCAALCVPRFAGADAGAQAAAQALFEQGRQLLNDGRAAEACAKFEESQRLDPAIGTQFNLAHCYERAGKTASAWSLYVEVESAARKAGQSERAEVAAERAAALRSVLPSLVIVVPPESRIEGLRVTRGGVEVGPAQWGVAVPVDPEVHTVVVAAPGKHTWEARVDLAAGGSTQLAIPVLRDATPAGSYARSEATGATSSSGLRTAAYVVGGIGVVGLGVGSYFGVRAINQKNDAACDENRCTPSGAETYSSAQRAGTASTVAFIVGGTALATGITLFVLSSRKSTSGLHAIASVAPGASQLAIGGAF